MSNYSESKKKLDKIRNEFGCKGEIVFRQALQYMIDYGKSTLLDSSWYQVTMDDIDAAHDIADKKGRILFVSRDFEKAIVDCAVALCDVDTYDLLIYIQKEVWLSHEGGLDYQRAIELLENCMSIITESHNDTAFMREDFEEAGFDDDELKVLGYDWVLNAEEENDC